MSDHDLTEEDLAQRRLAYCVEQWPECWSGGYDPRCCRFPKSCSPYGYIEAVLAGNLTDADLEPPASPGTVATMSDHDPLCVAYRWAPEVEVPCQCTLIRKVRAEQDQKWAQQLDEARAEVSDADLAAKSWEQAAEDAVQRLYDAQAAEATQRALAESARMKLHAALGVVDDLARQIDRLRMERNDAERELRHAMGRP